MAESMLRESFRVRHQGCVLLQFLWLAAYLQLHEVMYPRPHKVDARAPALGCVRGEGAVEVKQQDGPCVFRGPCGDVQKALRHYRRVM